MLKAVCQNTLPFHSHRKITARFDGGSLTSDAGWLLFGSLDRQHRLCEGFSSCIAESRDRRYVRHDLLKLIRQRVLQIVAGYEDCNDADTLRSDPMLKTVCDQLPESDPDLATQPTFSRLENSVTKKDLMRLSRWLLVYVFKGEAVQPWKATWVVRYDHVRHLERATVLKRIRELKRFTSYSEAESFLRSRPRGNHRIVGQDAFKSCVPLRKLRNHKLIYQSPSQTRLPNGEGGAEVELFEFTGWQPAN